MNVNPVFPFNAHYLSSIVLLDSRLVRTSDQPARQATSRECSHNYGRLATRCDPIVCSVSIATSVTLDRGRSPRQMTRTGQMKKISMRPITMR